MSDILEQIIESTIRRVEAAKKRAALSELKNIDAFKRSCLSLKTNLDSGDHLPVIAEFKRRSPSKGLINDQVAADDTAAAYQSAGVSAISVLTEPDFFSGSDADLIAARARVNIPILRKDFVIDEYQVIEAKSLGADIILLIAAVLDKKKLNSLYECAADLDLEVLVELHGEDELDKLPGKEELVGVNNRNLRNFSENIEHSINMLSALPDAAYCIAESGIRNPEVARQLLNAGFDGLLIGEQFMRSADPGLACKDFFNEVKSRKTL